MNTLHIDCPNGLGGDMLLAALAQLLIFEFPEASGPLTPLEKAFHTIGIPASIILQQETRQGFAGMQLHVTWPDGPEPQPLRHLHQLVKIVNALAVSPAVKKKAIAALERLAQVEAAVHNMPVDSVHFHEVGAIDTLVDVVGAFWALERLGITTVSCSALPWFSGTVTCEHGTIPLPAPATAALLRGKPVYPTTFMQEMITPTGALLLDGIVSVFADGIVNPNTLPSPAVTPQTHGPNGTLLHTGTAFGTRKDGGPLRLFLFASSNGNAEQMNERSAGHALLSEKAIAPTHSTSLPVPPHCRTEHIWVLESNIDHLTGEELGHCYDALFTAGAVDVLYTPATMKKNRPGGVLTVQCAMDALQDVQEAFLHHTHSLGIRRTYTERIVLERQSGRCSARPEEIETEEIETKDYYIDGRRMSRPEYEALKTFARKTGRSLPELRGMLSGAPQPAENEQSDTVEDDIVHS